MCINRMRSLLFYGMKGMECKSHTCTLEKTRNKVYCNCCNLQVHLSCQPRVTVTPCFVYNVIRYLESIDHLCVNPIHRIELIQK